MTHTGPVRRRHVFYVSGFDPNGPPRYHRLYSEEAQRQAAISGACIDVGKRIRAGPDTMVWNIRYREPASGGSAEVETVYRFARWDDIVRDHWWKDLSARLLDLLRTSCQYLLTGAMTRIYRQVRAVFVTLFAPFVLLVALIPGLLWTGWVFLALARSLHAGGPLARALLVVVATLVLAAFWAYWARRHWHSEWILRSYAFVGRLGGRGVPSQEARLDAIASALCRQVQKAEDDEVLIVGHSLGSIMAASVMARAFRLDPDLARHGPAIGLVTLGHCLPLLSNLPSAGRFRGELATLAAAPDWCWVDFSDPLDHYSFARIDPIIAAGLAPRATGHPRMKSPDIAQMIGDAPGQIPTMNQFEVHQQYLCASASGSAYDYFAITAGSLTLAARFGGPG